MTVATRCELLRHIRSWSPALAPRVTLVAAAHIRRVARPLLAGGDTTEGAVRCDEDGGRPFHPFHMS